MKNFKLEGHYVVKKKLKSLNGTKINMDNSIDTEVLIYEFENKKDLKNKKYIAISLDKTPYMSNLKGGHMFDIIDNVKDSKNSKFIYFLDEKKRNMISSDNIDYDENMRYNKLIENLANKHIGIAYTANNHSFESNTKKVLEQLISVVHPINYKLKRLEKAFSIKKTDLPIYMFIAQNFSKFVTFNDCVTCKELSQNYG